MIPFPGESVWISDAADVTGAPDGTLYEDIVHRAGSRTLTAGDEWRALVYSGDMDYPEETGLDCSVQWAVEVVSGTVTVSAAEGLDPTFADYGATLGVDLGTHTVTGPATLLIDSTFTADQVADLDGTVSAALQLGLTATSGSAVVQQVKLRVWPVGGALGAFVTQPGYDTTPTPAAIWAAADTERGAAVTTAGAEESWDAAHGALSSTSGPYEFIPVPPSSGHAEALAQYQAGQSNMGAPLVNTSVSVQSLVAMVEGIDWSTQGHVGAAAPGYIRPPEEVREEDEAHLYPQIGTGSTGWVDAMVTLAMTCVGPASIPTVTVYTESAPPPDPELTGPSSYMVAIEVNDDGTEQAVPGVGETLVVGTSLPTDDRFIFVHVSHLAAKSTPVYPGLSIGTPSDPAVVVGIDTRVAFGQGDPDGVFDPIMTYAQMPGYRLWYPDAAPEVPVRKLRQYHLDNGQGIAPRRSYGGTSRSNTGRRYGDF